MSFWTTALGAEIKYDLIAGIRTRTIRAGEDGPTVILMHGLSGHAESFIRNIVEMASCGFRVVAVDAVGHGFTDKPNATYHSPFFESHVEALIRTLTDEPVHLVGQSLGGWTALRLAQERPDLVRSVVSVTGAGIALLNAAAQEASREVQENVRQVTQRALDDPTMDRVRDRLEWLMADPASATDELVETRLQIFNLPSSRKMLRKVVEDVTSEANRKHLLDGQALASIKTPVLMMWSDRNPTVSAEAAREASTYLPNSRFEMVKNAGHWLQFEQAETFNAVSVDFLRQV